MSGTSTIPTFSAFGPRKPTRHDLMGIRFMTEPAEDGAGGTGGESGAGNTGDQGDGGGNYTAPTSQAELDRIINARLAREREKFKEFDAYKAAADELQRIKDEQKTPDQKAIDEAKAAGRAEALALLGQERFKNALDKALTGRVPDVGALLDLDRSQFIKDGTVDTDALKTWVTANSSEAPKGDGKDPGQGNRDNAGGTVGAGRSAYKDRHPTKK
jgi:hypothetical protein